jgi:hypothetical protein
VAGHDNRSPSPGEAGASPALSRNREPGPPPDESEHLAGWGSDTVRGRRWSPDGQPEPPDRTHHHPGLTKGLLVITTPSRRMLALLLSITTGLLAALVTTSPAAAAAYRYWSYWQGATGTWVAAQTGPGDHLVIDRDVQGWRFAISTAEVTAFPDNQPDFAALCPQLEASGAVAGQVRVAVVVDSGFLADAPEGQVPPADVVACVTVPEGSTGNQALAAAASVDEQGGLVCAVNGYPADECGAEVADADAAAAAAAADAEAPNPAVIAAPAAPAADAGDTGGGSPAAFVVGAAVLVALLVAAWLIPGMRRRRSGPDDALPGSAAPGSGPAPDPATDASR